MPVGLENQIREVVIQATKEAIQQYQKQLSSNEWMSLKEGAKYANVSYGTFIKFRERGLRVAEIDGVKRVSRKEIDSFLDKHSF